MKTALEWCRELGYEFDTDDVEAFRDEYEAAVIERVEKNCRHLYELEEVIAAIKSLREGK